MQKWRKLATEELAHSSLKEIALAIQQGNAASTLGALSSGKGLEVHTYLVPILKVQNRN